MVVDYSPRNRNKSAFFGHSGCRKRDQWLKQDLDSFSHWSMPSDHRGHGIDNQCRERTLRFMTSPEESTLWILFEVSPELQRETEEFWIETNLSNS